MTNKAKRSEWIQQEQKAFVERIEGHSAGSRSIYWLDETSVHCWMKLTKSFSSTVDPIHTAMQNKRLKGLTVFGCLDMHSHDSFYLTEPKTITWTMLDFLENFIKHLKAKGTRHWRTLSRLVLVLDNHPVHHAKLVIAWLKEHKITVEFLPPYSSALSCIEHSWSQMKHKWKKELASHKVVYDRDRYLAGDILEICRNLTVTPKLLAH